MESAYWRYEVAEGRLERFASTNLTRRRGSDGEFPKGRMG